MQTSFISEHTAELILVPKLLSSLSFKYSRVTPIYYWASREGGIMSQQSFKEKLIKILVLYPRRPKVSKPGSQKIQVKINTLLCEKAQFFKANDIPVIAGVPLADKLDDIHQNTDCLWLEVNENGIEETIEIDLVSRAVSSLHVKQLPLTTIFQLVEKSPEITWQMALEKITTARRENRSGMFNWMSGDLYKPIYFLVHID